MTRDVSIEYAHIYTNNHIGEEQELSLGVLGEEVGFLKEALKSFSLVALIDDYSFPDPTFDYESFFVWLSGKGFKPDLLFRESQLIPVCDQLLKELHNKKLVDTLVDYIKSKKYPCSLFVASWYLLRLGCLTHETFPNKCVAQSLLNILPRSFEPYEQKAFEIISASPYADLLNVIHNKYFEGRLIA